MFTAESSFVGSSLGFGRCVTHSKFLGEGLAGLAGLAGLSKPVFVRIRLSERLFLVWGKTILIKFRAQRIKPLLLVMACSLMMGPEDSTFRTQASICWVRPHSVGADWSVIHPTQRGRRRELGGKQPVNLWEKNEADMESSVLKRDRGKLGGAVLSKKPIGETGRLKFTDFSLAELWWPLIDWAVAGHREKFPSFCCAELSSAVSWWRGRICHIVLEMVCAWMSLSGPLTPFGEVSLYWFFTVRKMTIFLWIAEIWVHFFFFFFFWLF